MRVLRALNGKITKTAEFKDILLSLTIVVICWRTE